MTHSRNLVTPGTFTPLTTREGWTVRRRHGWALTAACALLGTIGAPPALAAPPPNDARADAQRLGEPPVTVRGTVVEATREETEPGSSCGATGPSVWYELPAGDAAQLVVVLNASGDLDAIVDVFERTRSQIQTVTCDATNRRGEAIADFDRASRSTYLIRVSALPNSETDSFSLQIVEPDEPATAPGRPLGPNGADGTVDRIANPDDAWSFSMRAGESYRVNLVPRGRRCAVAELHGPDPRSFGGRVVASMRCRKYLLVTPPAGRGGRYSLRVAAPRGNRGPIPYHVQVATAGEDDTAPGRFIRNGGRIRGALEGHRIDVVDLYRFDVTTPSRLDLRLRTASVNAFDLRLLSGGGKRISCSCFGEGAQRIRLRLRPGRYFAAVRARQSASGTYVLSRLSRTITRTRVTIDGERSATSAPGAPVGVAVAVRPGVAGPATVDIQRFDPLAGWQFDSRRKLRVTGGRASFSFTPPSVGRWRVIATYDGTRRASPSGPARASLLVAGPLRE